MSRLHLLLLLAALLHAEGFAPHGARFASLAAFKPPLSPSSSSSASVSRIPSGLLSAAVYEAQIPDNLGAFVLVFLTLAGTSAYWWEVIIPQARTKLAISKSKGDVRALLDEIVEDDSNEDGDMSPEKKAVLRWFFTDWLNKKTPKPAAIPFLKKAKWNSGDNPILVAFGGIMACVIAASLAERASIVIR